MIRSALAATLLLVLGCGAPERAVAQQPDEARRWGSDRALELIRRAQARRSAAADTGLISYRARAVGRVYFYLDREDTGERNLVKTDQLALDVFWQAPDEVKQRIIGWRDERSLPTNIHYHLDHLSVVQENFGETIRIGDGDEVQGVVHPAAPGADDLYEYRLVDSLTLALPGAGEPVRVYEIQARPRDGDQPGFVGSLFVERSRGDLVRMDFTFTAAAYVDRYLDYINISLDNGLWRGRYWLPNEQRVEIRRRIPELDIPAGSVIRANMRIGDYVFNEPMPPSMFSGPAVVALPRAQREAFEFEDPIDAEVRAEGLGREMELSEIRAAAARLVRARALRRLDPVRLRSTRASDLVRYNRAEGLTVGAGLTVQPSARVSLGASLGYAFGADHGLGSISISAGEAPSLAVSAYLNRPEDIGIAPAASGVMNSVTSLLAARDHIDPYYASGAGISARTPVGAWSAIAAVRVERHRAAALEETYSVFGDGFREVRPIEELDGVAIGEARVERAFRPGRADDHGMRLSLRAGKVLASGGGAWFEPGLGLGYRRGWRPADASLEVRASGGALIGDAPDHLGYLFGGRGTVPGFPFRRFGGDRFALLDGVASAEIAQPWIRGRIRGSAGWVGGDPPALAVEPDGPRASVGLGVGLLYDILRLDVARGIGRGGGWELVVEAHHAFWDFL